ncbi:helix-turn-helix transcriptional regulator [Oscillospiraceae bacterium PP1C4]
MISKSHIEDYISDRILLRAEDFLYVLPHELLRSYIANYTITFPNKNMISENYTIIPSGGATIVFSFNGNEIQDTLFGATTKTHIVGKKANCSQCLLIIEFHPYGLRHFIKTQQSELTNLLVPLSIVDPLLYQRTYCIFEQAQNVYELISALDNFFLEHSGRQTIKSELALAVDEIVHRGENITVRELSNQVYYSERHLNRIFCDSIGMNVKSFTRLVRINKAIRMLKKPQFSMTQVALQAGFYDQSHFIHEFMSICNTTPMEYLKNVSDYYNEICKF